MAKDIWHAPTSFGAMTGHVGMGGALILSNSQKQYILFFSTEYCISDAFVEYVRMVMFLVHSITWNPFAWLIRSKGSSSHAEGAEELD
jgi:hypothetical protein